MSEFHASFLWCRAMWCRAPMQCGHILVPSVVHVNQWEWKESTLVINVNRPFRLHGWSALPWPRFCKPIYMYSLLLILARNEFVFPAPYNHVFIVQSLSWHSRSLSSSSSSCRGSTLVINAGSFIVTTLPQIGLRTQIGETGIHGVSPKYQFQKSKSLKVLFV